MGVSKQIDEYVPGLDAKKTRAIDLHEGEKLDRAAFQALVRAASAAAAPSRKRKGK